MIVLFSHDYIGNGQCTASKPLPSQLRQRREEWNGIVRITLIKTTQERTQPTQLDLQRMSMPKHTTNQIKCLTYRSHLLLFSLALYTASEQNQALELELTAFDTEGLIGGKLLLRDYDEGLRLAEICCWRVCRIHDQYLDYPSP